MRWLLILQGTSLTHRARDPVLWRCSVKKRSRCPFDFWILPDEKPLWVHILLHLKMLQLCFDKLCLLKMVAQSLQIYSKHTENNTLRANTYPKKPNRILSINIKFKKRHARYKNKTAEEGCSGIWGSIA